jgi:beta-glucanase (GH16 family)
VRVENGHLIIDIKVEPFKGKHFTSARLNSKQAWAYGKFEARAKMPKGKHLWPAIWMMPQNSVYGQWLV